MHSVHFAAETSSNGVVERDFIVREVPGVLWSPASGSDHAPLVLMGHGGGLHKKTPAPGVVDAVEDDVVALFGQQDTARDLDVITAASIVGWFEIPQQPAPARAPSTIALPT
jgi:hypothetical protein